MKKRHRCKNCNSYNVVRIDQFDAEACKECKQWLYKTCLEPNCDFCLKRPADASNVDWDDKRNTGPIT